MQKGKSLMSIPQEAIESKIYFIRGKRVMLDKDLAVLYGVETRALNQAVRRNIKRFPDDFMFSLTRGEIMRISQFVISSDDPNINKLKFSKNVLAFTEQGVTMLSCALNSARAIDVNIQIIRVFTKLSRLISVHADLRHKIETMEKKYDHNFQVVFAAIKKLLEPPPPPLPEPPPKPRKPIGFSVE